MDYIIVESYSLYTLSNAVTSKMEDGYIPTGGPFIVDTPKAHSGSFNDYSELDKIIMKRNYCQAMYKLIDKE